MPSKKINTIPTFDAFDFMQGAYHAKDKQPMKRIEYEELLEASQKSFNERHGTKDKDSKIVTLSKGWVDFEEHEKTEDND